MELSKFQNFYAQLLSKIESELAIDKDKLSMILHSHVREETIDTLLIEFKDIYKASKIELWFLDPTYNRYYLFDKSIAIRHVFRSMTKSLSTYHFDSFFKSNQEANAHGIIQVKKIDNFIIEEAYQQTPILAIPIDEKMTGVVIIYNHKKQVINNEMFHVIKQNIDLIASLLYTDSIDYSPYYIIQPTINIKALLGLEKLVDLQTHIHEAKTAKLARAIAISLKLPSYTVEKIEIASKLHDIGKLFVPKSILIKREPLSPDEIKILETHVAMGVEILSLLGFSRDITKLVLEHHERMDGSGYPLKLKNYQFTLESQIVAISDELSVIVANDFHHEKTSNSDSIFELFQYKGIKYNAELIETIELMIKNKTLLPLLKY